MGRNRVSRAEYERKKTGGGGVFRAEPYSFLIKNKIVNMVFNPWDLLLLLGLFIFLGVFFLVFVGLLLWLLMVTSICIRNQNIIVSPGVIFISVGGGPPLTESYVLVASGIITVGVSAGTGLFHRHAAKTR